jgi:Flp pilus assembly protein TadG
MRAFLHMIRCVGTDRRGNIAVIFALALLPVMAAVGCVIDYSMASRIKAKMQSAADAATVAAIAQKSPGYNAAVLMTSDGAVPDAVSDAYKVFDLNMTAISGYANASRTGTVTKTGIKLTSRVDFSADVPVTFLGVLRAFGLPGYQTIRVGGSASSSASLATYLDFYLLLDVSGSMGLPSTTAEAARLQQISPDNFVQYPTGCTLACHFAPQNSACVDPGKSNSTQGYPTNGYCLGYAISRVSPSRFQNLLVLQNPQGKYPYKNSTSGTTNYQKYLQLPSSMVSGLPGSLNTDPTYGLPAVASCPADGTDNCIQLRLDAVGYAVNELFKTANSSMKVTDQFRIGLYPFITDIDENYAKLTSSISGDPTTPGTINYAAAQLATQLDTNLNANLGSGGTHIDNALHSLNSLITTVGTGSSSTNRKPFVFLVTDGAQDNQYKDVPNGSWHGSNHATVLTDRANDYPSICSTMTNRQIIVAVLYIPYQQINPVNTSFAGNEDTYANNNIDDIPASLRACASPGFFFTANSPKDITAALNAMFSQSLVTAHITN